jgi:hypothetical protein
MVKTHEFTEAERLEMYKFRKEEKHINGLRIK